MGCADSCVPYILMRFTHMSATHPLHTTSRSACARPQDDLGDMEQPAPAIGLAGNGGRGADSVIGTGTSSTAVQPPPEQTTCQLQFAGTVQSSLCAGEGQALAGQQPEPGSGKQAAASDQAGANISMHDRSQRVSTAAARMKPALSCALDGSVAPALLSVGLDGQADKLLTEYALSGSAAGIVDIKVPDRAPSPHEVVAELGALVKELRGNVNHVAIVLEGVLGHGSFGTVYKGRCVGRLWTDATDCKDFASGGHQHVSSSFTLYHSCLAFRRHVARAVCGDQDGCVLSQPGEPQACSQGGSTVSDVQACTPLSVYVCVCACMCVRE